MLRKLTARIQSEEKGFTLIELLVVILIIGILAAIAIPSFLGQRAKAQDTEAKTAVRSAATAAEAFYTDSRTFDGMTDAALKQIEPTLNDTPGTFTVTESDTGYVVEVTSKTKNKFTISRDANSKMTRTCTTTGGGQTGAGCPATGSW